MQFMRMRLKPNRLRHIFISHLHGDHCYGLPGLLSTLSLGGIEGHVTVHLPEEGIRLLKPLIDYTSHDLQVEFAPYEYGSNIIYEDKSLTVSTMPLVHRMPCVGFIFREKEKLRHLNREMANFHQVPVAMLARIKAGDDYVKPDGTIVDRYGTYDDYLNWLSEQKNSPLAEVRLMTSQTSSTSSTLFA